MGMFDNVIPEFPLPDEGAKRVNEWQTKDFDAPFMDKYRITPEGRLLEELYDIEDQSDPTAEPGTLASLRGMMTRVNVRERDMDYHGVLNFYGTTADGEWFEYNATFTHGALEKVERVAVELAVDPSRSTPERSGF